MRRTRRNDGKTISVIDPGIARRTHGGVAARAAGKADPSTLDRKLNGAI